LTARVAKLARAACTFFAVLAVVAAGAVLLVAVLMPFVFPLFLVGAPLVTRRLSRRASRGSFRDLPPANETDAAAQRRNRARGLTAARALRRDAVVALRPL
jgi:hypothetical protein